MESIKSINSLLKKHNNRLKVPIVIDDITNIINNAISNGENLFEKCKKTYSLWYIKYAQLLCEYKKNNNIKDETFEALRKFINSIECTVDNFIIINKYILNILKLNKEELKKMYDVFFKDKIISESEKELFNKYVCKLVNGITTSSTKLDIS